MKGVNSAGGESEINRTPGADFHLSHIGSAFQNVNRESSFCEIDGKK
jgi:hypothetical protein